MTKTKEKKAKCPSCGLSSGIYHRKKDNTMRCSHCGEEWPTEEKKEKK